MLPMTGAIIISWGPMTPFHEIGERSFSRSVFLNFDAITQPAEKRRRPDEHRS